MLLANLTIENEQRLKTEIEQMKEKSGESDQEKDMRIKALEEQIQGLVQSQKEILECLKHPDKIIQISQKKIRIKVKELKKDLGRAECQLISCWLIIINCFRFGGP